MTQRDEHEQVERPAQGMDRVLRDLPLRRAPASLESRVLRELQRRAALQWWRRSFAHWPLLARSGFVVVCGVLIGLSVLGRAEYGFGSRPLEHLGAMLLSWVRPATAVMGSAAGLADVLMRAIPPLWLYGGLGAGALLYAILFGLGAAAYRALYLAPLNDLQIGVSSTGVGNTPLGN